jgi:hypothetical protein
MITWGKISEDLFLTPRRNTQKIVKKGITRPDKRIEGFQDYLGCKRNNQKRFYRNPWVHKIGNSHHKSGINPTWPGKRSFNQRQHSADSPVLL